MGKSAPSEFMEDSKKKNAKKKSVFLMEQGEEKNFVWIII